MTSNDRTRDGVLVLDSDSQCGLAVIRSLGRRGVSVTAGGHRPRSLGMCSRYIDGTYVHPDPQRDAERFVSDLDTELERAAFFAVIPVSDHTTYLLAHHKAALERTGTVIACADRKPFDRAFDKASLFEVAASIDVPTPSTYAPTSIHEVEELADTLDHPSVIKPRSKTHVTDSGYTVSLVTDENYVDSPAELVAQYRRIVDREGRYPLIQAYVPGRTTTTVALADQGAVLAYFQEERLRTYPSSGGNSALLGAVSEPRMLEYAERVLGHLEWTGPAMVEFMRTPDGQFFLIEVNGRYWGSLPFAIACGVDFPWLHYLQLQGRDPSAAVEFGEYRTDIVQRRLLYEDIKWLLENLDAGNVGAVGPFLRAFPQTRHTFVSFDDPLPTAAAILQAGRLGTQALLGRMVNGVGASRAGRAPTP